MKTFRPTHVIALDGAEPVEVMLCDTGAAYTREEWQTCAEADYECSDAGEWFRQGEPFNGTVETVPGGAR